MAVLGRAAILEAIEQGDAAAACRQMLDYYDRCYDHDLSSHTVRSVDLGNLSAAEAARLVLEQGLAEGRRAGSAG
jgi:tRNA 2-selenouridine synthase